MKAQELLDAGHLSGAIEQLNLDVKFHPTDSRLRTFLFELLCFTGDYQRAERHLDVLAGQSVNAEAGVHVYRNILAAETARHRLFSEGLRPDFLLEPPPYLHLHLEAVNRLRENKPAKAKVLLERSERDRPGLKGRLEGRAFLGFQDADDLIGPFLEVIVQRNYVWLPFEQITHLKISAPKRLRDLLWIPATLETRNAPVREVFLPVLYAGSNEHSDEQVKLGRMTDWKAVGEGLTLGVGQRLWLADDEVRAMLEVREVEFEAETNGGET
jgi:type VI secretion system protein ImpE